MASPGGRGGCRRGVVSTPGGQPKRGLMRRRGGGRVCGRGPSGQVAKLGKVRTVPVTSDIEHVSNIIMIIMIMMIIMIITIIIDTLMPVEQNSFTHPRALLVLCDCGSYAHVLAALGIIPPTDVTQMLVLPLRY
jgi:hypothetical protein